MTPTVLDFFNLNIWLYTVLCFFSTLCHITNLLRCGLPRQTWLFGTIIVPQEQQGTNLPYEWRFSFFCAPHNCGESWRTRHLFFFQALWFISPMTYNCYACVVYTLTVTWKNHPEGPCWSTILYYSLLLQKWMRFVFVFQSCFVYIRELPNAPKIS